MFYEERKKYHCGENEEMKVQGGTGLKQKQRGNDTIKEKKRIKIRTRFVLN